MMVHIYCSYLIVSISVIYVLCLVWMSRRDRQEMDRYARIIEAMTLALAEKIGRDEEDPV